MAKAEIMHKMLFWSFSFDNFKTKDTKEASRPNSPLRVFQSRWERMIDNEKEWRIYQNKQHC